MNTVIAIGSFFTLLTVVIIACCCWPGRYHRLDCPCRVCSQRDPRPGGTL